MNLEEKLKYLEFIQNTINRMATNSFVIKGWCITIIAGLFALSENDTSQKYTIIAIASSLLFMFLDTYYLQLEKKYRKLYDDVRVKNKTDFSMDINSYYICFFDVLCSKTVCLFYGILVIGLIIFLLL